MRKSRSKRALGLVLTLCMVLTLLPSVTLPAFAADGEIKEIKINVDVPVGGEPAAPPQIEDGVTA